MFSFLPLASFHYKHTDTYYVSHGMLLQFNSFNTDPIYNDLNNIYFLSILKIYVTKDPNINFEKTSNYLLRTYRLESNFVTIIQYFELYDTLTKLLSKDRFRVIFV